MRLFLVVYIVRLLFFRMALPRAEVAEKAKASKVINKAEDIKQS